MFSTNHAVPNRSVLGEFTKTMSCCGDRRAWTNHRLSKPFWDDWVVYCFFFSVGGKQKPILNGSVDTDPHCASWTYDLVGITALWAAKCQMTSWRLLSKNPCTWVSNIHPTGIVWPPHSCKGIITGEAIMLILFTLGSMSAFIIYCPYCGSIYVCVRQNAWNTSICICIVARLACSMR